MSLHGYRLRKCLDGAFGWITQNLELFHPFLNETEGGEPDLYRSKALCELGLMCMLYYRCTEEALDPRVQNFVSFIHDIWQQPAYQDRGVRNLETFRLYTMIYVNLLRCGAVESSYSEIIQRFLEQGYVTAVELVPMRVLDFRHMLDSGGFRHNLQSYDDIYQATLLAKTPPLVYFTDSDVYDITHTLFYVTDFGSQPASVLPKEQIPTVQWMIGALLGVYLRRRNWDIVGELLLNCLCLRWYPPIVFDVAWDSLLQAQLPDGSTPGPLFSQEERQKLDEAEQRAYDFKHNYHTTLVCAITCFLSDPWVTSR